MESEKKYGFSSLNFIRLPSPPGAAQPPREPCPDKAWTSPRPAGTRFKSSFRYSRRYYSSLSSSPNEDLPLPMVTFYLTDDIDIKTLKNKLKGKGGIYSIVNTVNGKQYIGSARDFYIRLNEHLNYRNNSNVALQRAIIKHGLGKFKFCIFEFFTYDSKIISHKSLTDLETYYITRFNFDTLYNFSPFAHNNLGYKHSEVSKLKISKPGKLFGNKHSKETKSLISNRMSKYPSGVGIFDLNENLIEKFKNNTELAKHLNISRVTVGKYLNNKLVYTTPPARRG